MATVDNKALIVNDPVEDEPDHPCCIRILLCPLSIFAAFPAAIFVLFELANAPILFCAAICCKMGVCNFCCPENIHECCRNGICTPCRWMRISCTGRGIRLICASKPFHWLVNFLNLGHIVCWKHPAWPFRKDVWKECCPVNNSRFEYYSFLDPRNFRHFANQLSSYLFA